MSTKQLCQKISSLLSGLYYAKVSKLLMMHFARDANAETIEIAKDGAAIVCKIWILTRTRCLEVKFTFIILRERRRSV